MGFGFVDEPLGREVFVLEVLAALPPSGASCFCDHKASKRESKEHSSLLLVLEQEERIPVMKIFQLNSPTDTATKARRHFRFREWYISDQRPWKGRF